MYNNDDEKFLAIIEVLTKHGIGPNATKNQLTGVLSSLGRSKEMSLEFRKKCVAASTELFVLDFGTDVPE